MAYFVPGDPAAGGTEERSPARGDLRLLSPSTTVSNLVFYASHSYYDALSSAGVKIYECQDALLHAKAVFIEGGGGAAENLDYLEVVHVFVRRSHPSG